jgi:undecaprenyl-diphosphatase
MALFRVKPTRLDRAVARTISAHTDPEIEATAERLTWGADEHVLLLAAALFWAGSRAARPSVRRLGRHFLVTALATSVAPHAVKAMIDQERPDRKFIAAHRKGIPFSGQRNDAFPSGHALHMGALASAATLLPRRERNAAWGFAAVLSITRIALLAHWTSDVVAGLVLGAALERGIRKVTAPIPVRARPRMRERK